MTSLEILTCDSLSHVTNCATQPGMMIIDDDDDDD